MSASAKVALIIGIDEYDNKYDLGPLHSSLKDAEDLRDNLVNNGYSLFDNQIIIGSRPPSEGTVFDRMEDAMRTFFKSAKHDQMLLFYFSGHGFRTEHGYYLASPQFNPEYASKGFAVNELIRIMKASPSRKIICIIDACYSGSTSLSPDNEKLEVKTYYDETWRNFKDDKIHLLLSSKTYEESESGEKGENSVFTKHLLDGLAGAYKKDARSVNAYGCVTPKTLYDYVYHKVIAETDERQKPDHKYEGDAHNITIAYHPHLAVLDPENATTLKRIGKISDLATYYNVDDDRRVNTREQTIEDLKQWVVNWSRQDRDNNKKILLITGAPGCGKSWLAFKLTSELFEDYEILEVKGNKIQDYPIGIGKRLYPVFILDDRHIGIEGIFGGIPMSSVCDIIQNCTQFEYAGPVILSMRQDTWNMIISGSIQGCNKLQRNIEKKIIERKELELNSDEALNAADKVIRSFYEKVDRNQPPFDLQVTTDIKNEIIKRSGCNLVIIKIFFEEIGRPKKAPYTIVMKDLDGIASNPVYYVLYQLFRNYFSSEKNQHETAGILAGLYYIAESGSISVGSLYHLWRKYYQNKSRSLPIEVYKYLSTWFSGKRPNEFPPPLFDIDRYGSIISFHNSVDSTLRRLIDDHETLIEETKNKRHELDKEIGDSNREYIEENLEHVKDNINYIKSQIKIFREQYIIDIDYWIKDTFGDLIDQKASKGNQIVNYQIPIGGKIDKANISAKEAYYFLSMFKEYIEPKKSLEKGEIDINRYSEFRLRFESIFRTVDIRSDYENPGVSNTVNRLLYHVFEKVRAEYIRLEAEARNEDNATTKAIAQNEGQLLYQFGAYDTDLDLMLEDYFPEKDYFNEPPLSGDDHAKLLLLRRVGLSLMTIGKLYDADIIYSKNLDMARSNKLWMIDAGKVLQLKAELYIHLGRLEDSICSANEAILLYAKTITGEFEPMPYCSTGDEMWGVQNIAMGPIQLIICSLVYQAWSLHLAGCLEYASITFLEAEKLAKSINPNPDDRPKNVDYPNKAPPMQHLRDLWGVYHADHLMKKTDSESLNLAKIITEENLKYAKCNRLTEIISQCYRIFGDINMRLGDEEKQDNPNRHNRFYAMAVVNYIDALEEAQKTSHGAVLIEAYLGLGLFYIKEKDYDGAINSCLRKAYDKLDNSKNYKFYKTDLEVALAKAYLGKNKSNDLKESCKFATMALETSKEINYYWGGKEAMNLVDHLKQRYGVCVEYVDN